MLVDIRAAYHTQQHVYMIMRATQTALPYAMRLFSMLLASRESTSAIRCCAMLLSQYHSTMSAGIADDIDTRCYAARYDYA